MKACCFCHRAWIDRILGGIGEVSGHLKDIAIVGLGCILPDAFSPQQFWENNIKGHSALQPLGSHNRWKWKLFHSTNKTDTDKTYTITAGAIKNYQFDWKKYRIPPNEVKGSNPMQFMILDAGTQALEQVKHIPNERTGIYIGSTGSGWQKDTCLQIHKDAILKAIKQSPAFLSLPYETQGDIVHFVQERVGQSLQDAAEENMIVHSLASIACGRIAQYFDIKGPHVSIDSGYASSLAALEVGIRSLQEGSVDLALIGGASEILTPLNMIAFSKLGGLSSSELRAFDALADGTLLGEGTAMFALKRLKDARRDNEHIYAVVRGIGHSSDGSGKSIVAPDDRGQALAMRRAYEDADIDPSTLSYIECHATGTQVGDVSELKALASFHQNHETYQIAIGSGKPNVGHLGAAAGAVGLLRTVLTLYHQTIPPQLHVESSNPHMNLPATPFVIPSEPLPLKVQKGTTMPRAAVSSFGFGGTNYHAVLEAYSAEAEPEPQTFNRQSSFELEPIAIIGMSGMFPDAADEQAFWANVKAGKNSITNIPEDRFDIELYWDDSKTNPKKTYTKKGGFLSSLSSDSLKWKIPPSSAAYVDESHYLALHCAERALQDAGYDPTRWNREKTSVMLGFLAYQNKKLQADLRVNYQEIHPIIAGVLDDVASDISLADRRAIAEDIRQQFMSNLPAVTEDTLPGYLGSLTAGRIAKHFDFHGAQLATDAACCSAHLAFLLGVQALRHKTSDVVLVGGVNADMAPEFYVGGCGIQALTADEIRPFDANADGFLPGEGGGFFVLRRLSDAQKDGQNILAVIRSVSSTSDGKSGSILAPSLAGEAGAMTQALQQAGISPELVDYVECHGTGTAKGDAIEVEAMAKAYGANRTKPLRIGSVKSNIGHLLAGAAVPAVMKTIFALREGIIPPSLHVEVLNPTIAKTNGNIRVVTTCEEWETSNNEPRRAGVSGFGLGGANSHLILEEYRPAFASKSKAVLTTYSAPLASRILPIAAMQGENLADCATQMLLIAENMVNHSEEEYKTSLRDLQLLHHQVRAGTHRIAIVANHPRELVQKARLLTNAVSKGINPDFLKQQGVFVAKVDTLRKVAVVFPGQGVQYPNMFRDIMQHFPEAAAFMQQIDQEYEALCGKSLTDSFFTDSPENYRQNDEDIHCAVFAVNCAMFTLLRSYGLEFDAAIGQSAGELAAFVAAEALSLRDALKAVRGRTQAVLSLSDADPGQMMTVYCSAEEARRHFHRVNGYCDISADNSPEMCIVSGETSALQELRSWYLRHEIQAEMLPVSHGYHSLMIANARKPYRQILDTCTFTKPTRNVISTITGNELGSMRVQQYPELLESQFVEPVRLRQAIETAYGQGIRLFIECGPKWAVSSYVSETLKDKEFCVQASLHPKIGEVEQLHRALACMYVHGKGQLFPIKNRKESTMMNQNHRLNHDHATGDKATLLFLKSMRDMIDAFLQSRPTVQSESRADDEETALAMQVKEMIQAQQPSMQEVINQVQPTEPYVEEKVSKYTEEEIGEVVLSLMVQRTGYPKDMLELDLDLEADLGIDTVKQVAILADARQHFGLDQEPGFRVREYHTLRKIIAYFAARIGVSQTTEGKQPAFFR